MPPVDRPVSQALLDVRVDRWTSYAEKSLAELEADINTLILAIPTSEKRNLATELNMDLMKFREKFDALKKMEVK